MKKTFEDALFEPHRVKRFSDIAMSKGEVKNKFGDLIKQLQELILHLFDKSEEPEIKCKVVSEYDEENEDWVDGLELPDGEFSKMNLKSLGELLKQRKKMLPCKIKLTDDKGNKVKEPVVNGYVVFLHPKTDKQNEPSMPWENKTEEGVKYEGGDFVFDFKMDNSDDVVYLTYKNLLKERRFQGIKIIYGSQIIGSNSGENREIGNSFMKKFKNKQVDQHSYDLFLSKVINKFSYDHPIGEYSIIVSPSTQTPLLNDVVRMLKSKAVNTLLASDVIIKNTIDNIKIDYEKYNSKAPTKWDVRTELDKQFHRATQEGTFKIKKILPMFRKFFSNFLIFKNDTHRQIFNSIRGGNVLIVEDYITSGNTLKEILRLVNELAPKQITIFVFISNKQ